MSTFHFTARFDLSSARGGRPADRDDLSGLPVLVIDDNVTNRRILEEQLLGWGMKPVLADRGTEVLSLLQRAEEKGEPFALVLLDASMPDVDGFTVARWIQRTPDVSRATIMMLSSGGLENELGRCRELGIATVGWLACCALRMRVSISAIGSCIVMSSSLP